MHKSAILRYFETREQIFLALTADGWHEWSAALCARLSDPTTASPGLVATVIAQSLVARVSVVITRVKTSTAAADWNANAIFVGSAF